jgi:hypothetical protein
MREYIGMCSAREWDYHGDRKVACGRKAVVVERGKRWCCEHAPSTRRRVERAGKAQGARAATVLAAHEAVVKAAMGSYRHGYITNTCSDLHAACAALDKLEKEYV